MRVWRICKRTYQRFDGEGPRLYGGRWNHPGVPVIYTSASLSLAALELFVHVSPDLIPTDLVAIPAEISEGLAIEKITPAKLPKTWRQYPAPGILKDLGSTWLAKSSTPVLEVPSAVIPAESNYLLNPRHDDFRRIRVFKSMPFQFDARMWK